MDWSPQTYYHSTHYETLDTPNLAESGLIVTTLGDKDQLHYIIEEVAHAHAQNAPFEWCFFWIVIISWIQLIDWPYIYSQNWGLCLTMCFRHLIHVGPYTSSIR